MTSHTSQSSRVRSHLAHINHFPETSNAMAPLLDNHVYEILGGQMFHPRISYPKVLAFKPAHLLSDSLFPSSHDTVGRANMSVTAYLSVLLFMMPSGAYMDASSQP